MFDLNLSIVQTVDDLLPMDWIDSHKRVEFDVWPPAQLAEYIADQGIIGFQKKQYPEGITDSNHNRIVIGKINGEVILFEWTYPRARFVVAESWMVDSNYARVQRLINEDTRGVDPMWMYNQFKPHEGSKYDWLQGLGILLNWKWLQLSEERRMCSTGATFVSEQILKRRLFPEIAQWRTPPCSVSNHPEEWTWVNKCLLDDVMLEVSGKSFALVDEPHDYVPRVMHSV